VRPAAAILLLSVLIAGCGLDVQAADLFLLTRTGAGPKLTMLVNDSGTVSCDGGKAKPLSDPLLLQARDLATSLDKDAKSKLHLPPRAHSVYQYTVKLQDGTISFPDTEGATHQEFAQAELFATRVADGLCRSAT
jgi:hypothetical protein